MYTKRHALQENKLCEFLPDSDARSTISVPLVQAPRSGVAMEVEAPVSVPPLS